MTEPTLHSKLLPHLAGYIDGAWVSAANGARVPVEDPATGRVLAHVPRMGAAEAVRAVAAAARVFDASGEGEHGLDAELRMREEWLKRIAARILEEKDEFGRIVTLENGKPLAEGRGEAEYAAGFFANAATQLGALRPKVLTARPRGHGWTVHHRPAGVAALITPWNFPLAMIAKKLSAAIGAGCPVVIKPALKTPLSMIALFTVLEEVGIPPGRANLVIGDSGAIGKVLCEHPEVRIVSFTGSTAVGQSILAATAPYVKRVALELGGNAPFLVFQDADLPNAVEHLVQNKLRASGQTCVCTNRVFVHHSVAESFARLLADRVGRLHVGNGMDEGVDLGPLIDRDAFEKVESHVQDALRRGATAVTAPPGIGVASTGAAGTTAAGTAGTDAGTTGAAADCGAGTAGSAADSEVADTGAADTGAGDRNAAMTGSSSSGAHGFFFPPTVLRSVPESALCAQEETFGPLFPIFEFDTEEEAVAAANDTIHGLAAYLFTADEERAGRIIGRLRFGHVGHNTGTGPVPEAPFGGMKQSGIGREGGSEGLMEYVELQTVPRS
ncbi:MAG: NAD-dependent succinate-semialdehyde dehydrogenase [Candidatus Eisenbacteria bacterium]